MGAVSKHLGILAEADGESRARRLSAWGLRAGGNKVGIGKWMPGIAQYIAKQPRWLVAGFGFAMSALLGWIDYLAGAAFSFTMFYFVPVALVTWFVGRRAGSLTAVACAISWSLAYIANEPALLWGAPVPYWNIASSLGVFLVVSFALSGLRDALSHQSALARTDPMTGAPNSRAFFEQVERELERSQRYNHPFTVAYIDADNFKLVNDWFGHNAGDELLRSVAASVRHNLRATDMVARIAGDEFTILLPETGHEEAEMVIARVRRALSATMQRNGWLVTFSIGVVTYVTPPPGIDALIKFADDLMYSVKRSGKNSVRHEVYGAPDVAEVEVDMVTSG